MIINKFNITKSDYEIVANDFGIDFVLGAGVDMNSETPKGRNNLVALDDIPEPEIVDTDEWRLSTIDCIESSRVEEYFKALSISLKASYGLSSGSLNYSRIINEMKDNYMVIFLITDKSVKPHSLNHEKILTEPLSETSLEDDDARTWQFLQDFGSHYINKISSGYQIAFEAKVAKVQFSDEMTFSGSLNLAFGAFAGGLGVNMAEVAKLKTKGVTINGRIISGGIEPDTPLTIGSIDDLTELLKELSDGSKTIKRGPYKLYLQSYWRLLTDFPKTRKLLAPVFTEQVKGEYGVPSGTIIAYYPQIDINVPALLADNEFYWLPEGWVICNGLNNTPNLIDKFIMGSDKQTIGETGGRAEHSHRFVQAGYDTTLDDSGNPTGWLPSVENHLPPFCKLIYIMRL